ncbi:MAG: hypothetical protein L0H93_00395 [Nocardioides sp.]|nr:hypothetical protein [Nocardioides sp.]
MRGARLVVTLVASAIVLAGCGQGGGDSSAPEPGTVGGTHTMPDGTVMSDSEMGQDPSSSEEASEPSPAARMVCAGDVSKDVRRIAGLDRKPAVTSTWDEPLFTCTYTLEDAPLVLTVHDATDESRGRAHFAALRKQLGTTTDIKGVYSLGLPAYETGDGVAAFIRDGKTLEVDATRLPRRSGPEGGMSRADMAYAVATSVLACWTEHT